MSGRHRRDDDQVDRGSVDARIGQGGDRGGRRDVGERLLLGRKAPLADAGALDDPLVRRVDELLEILVREDTVRDVDAEAGDADPPAVGRADHDDRSTAKVRVPRTASSPSTVARALPRPIGPAHRLEVAFERQLVARAHDALEANVVDAGEEGDPATVLLLAEHRDRAGLGERLDHLHAGHDRVPGKVARAVLLRDELEGDDAAAGTELGHLVQQQEWVAVREDRLDRGLVHGQSHAESRSRSPFRPRWA